MVHLERLTTEYIPFEDRLRISGQVSSTRTVKLWLTQRMLSLLLPHLFDWLQKKTNSFTNSSAYDTAGMRHIVQTFEQEVAIANLVQQDQTPVTSMNVNEDLLIHSIDITTGDLAIQIGFKSEAIDEELKLINITMEKEPLRQWLHIIYSQTRQGGWLAQKWPEWMNDISQDSPNLRQLAH